MKKLTAILITAVLLFNSIYCGIVSTLATENYKTNFYFDFSTQAKYDDMLDGRPAGTTEPRTLVNISSGSGTISYDGTNNALKLVGDGTKAPVLNLRCLDFRQGLFMGEYTALALKVKLNGSEVAFQSATMFANDGAASTTASRQRSLNSFPSYAASTGWQLLVIDLSSENYGEELADIAAQNAAAGTKSTWWGTELTLGAAGYTGPIYVEWAGIFENQGKALAQYALTTPNVTSNFMFDFSTQVKYDDMLDGRPAGTTEPRTMVNVQNTGSGTVSFDETNSALKLVGDGSKAPALNLRCLDFRQGLTMEKYTTLALKVKLDNTAAAFQSATMYSNDGVLTGVSGAGDVKRGLKSSPSYAANTGWQLLVIDLSSKNYGAELAALAAQNAEAGSSSTWWGAELTMGIAGYTGPVYVAWAGIFENESNAIANYLNTTPDADLGDIGFSVPATPKPSYDGFYFDFSTKVKYDDMLDGRPAGTTEPRTMVNISSGSGTISYENGALKLVGDGTKAPVLNLRCLDFRQGLFMGEYTALALKVKLNGNEADFQSATMFSNDGVLSVGGGVADAKRALKSYPSYAASTGWQLLVIDLSSENYGEELADVAARNAEAGSESTWWGTELTLGAAGYTGPIYVEWAGIFENEGKALAQYALTTPNVTSNFMFDFSTQVKYDDMLDGRPAGTTEPRTMVNVSSGSGTVSFDVTNSALKLVGDGAKAPTLNLRCLDFRQGLTMEKYTTLALKVKLDDTDAAFQSAAMFSNDGILTGVARSAEVKRGLKTVPSYAAGTGWQLLVLDLSSKNYGAELALLAAQNAEAGSSSTWWGAELTMGIAGYAGPIYVEWAGIFENESNAIANYLSTTPDADLGDVGFSAGGKPSYGSFFYDFRNSAAYNENVENPRVNMTCHNASTLSYDETQKALKLSTTDSVTTPYLLLQSSDRVVNINTGHVLAVKVKISGAGASFQSALMYAKDDASVDGSIGGNNSIENPGSAKELREYPDYTNTSAWQLLLIDLSDSNRYSNLADKTGVWYGVRMNFGTINSPDPFYVAWVGVFSDAEAAEDYFEYTTPDNTGGAFEDDSGDDDLNPDAPEAPTPIFWDFTLRSTVSNQVGVAGDTAAEFDSSLNAMKVLATDKDNDGSTMTTPGSISLGSRTAVEKNIPIADYPIFALRVKMSSRELVGGMLRITSTGSREKASDGLIDSAKIDIGVLDYAGTTNWQTVVIDYRDNPTAAFFLDGDWQAVDIDMLDSYQTAAQDAVWVKWAGAFASMADVEAYVAATARFETGNTDDVGGDNEEQDDETVPSTGYPWMKTAAVLFLTNAAAVVVLTAYKKRRARSK